MSYGVSLGFLGVPEVFEEISVDFRGIPGTFMGVVLNFRGFQRHSRCVPVASVGPKGIPNVFMEFQGVHEPFQGS